MLGGPINGVHVVTTLGDLARAERALLANVSCHDELTDSNPALSATQVFALTERGGRAAATLVPAPPEPPPVVCLTVGQTYRRRVERSVLEMQVDAIEDGAVVLYFFPEDVIEVTARF